ncbi:MAG TPA: 2-oxo acid dehydrogenase subunit E2 [Candidatus Binatia bacterium]
MAEVTMPKLSDTMEEGKILRWLKQAGERVEAGELLVEVETDKADMEVEAPASGILREVKLGEGESAPVGAVIAVIDGAGEAAGAGQGEKKAASREEASAPRAEAKPQSSAQPPQRTAQRPAETRAEPPASEQKHAAAAPRESAQPRASAPKSVSPPKQATVRVMPPRPVSQGRPPDGIKASPLARQLAAELGIDLRTVRGTGPVGRITRRDVELAAAAAAKRRPQDGGKSASAEALDETPSRETVEGAEPGLGVVARREEAAPGAERPAQPERESAEAAPDREGAKPEAEAAPEPRKGEAAPAARESRQEPGETRAEGGVRRVPLSRMRASIGKRMSESAREAPHFYLTTVVDMDEAVRMREQIKRLELSPVGVTYNHMVIKAVADALAEFPEVNARFAGDAIEMLEEINVGIATAVPDGLIVPVVHGADRLSLLEIAEQARALAEKAESGRFTSADLSGATFSVSNLGMFDVDSFTAVINPPQAAILAVGSVKQRPVVRDGALGVGYTMSMTLSCDHRVIDGALGGRFLADVKRRLESPVALLLGGGA